MSALARLYFKWKLAGEDLFKPMVGFVTLFQPQIGKRSETGRLIAPILQSDPLQSLSVSPDET